MTLYYIVHGQKVSPNGQPYIEAEKQPEAPAAPADPETIVPAISGAKGGDPVSPDSSKPVNYAAYTVPELKALCESRGLTVVSTGKRPTHPLERDYIAAIEAADKAVDADSL